MEIAIPLLALGGMYIISNQETGKDKDNGKLNEKFTNFGSSKTSQYLPNVNMPPDNYPIINNSQLSDNVQHYQGTNVAADIEPGRSSPGIPSFLPFADPVAITTAS